MSLSSWGNARERKAELVSAEYVFFTGCWARRASYLALGEMNRKFQAFSMAADPADLAGRVADDEREGFDVFGDDSTGADKRVFAKFDAADDSGVGADGGSFFDEGLLVFAAADDGAAGIDDIGEDHAGAQENVLFADDARVYADIILDLDVASQDNSRADDDILANVARGAERGPFHDMAEVPDFCLRADFGFGANDSCWMGEISGSFRGEMVVLGRIFSFAVGIEAGLGRLENLEDAQTFAPIGAGRNPVRAALKEMQAFFFEGLGLRNFDRDGIVFIRLRDVAMGPGHRVAVEQQLFVPGFGVVEDSHS